MDYQNSNNNNDHPLSTSSDVPMSLNTRILIKLNQIPNVPYT